MDVNGTSKVNCIIYDRSQDGVQTLPEEASEMTVASPGRRSRKKDHLAAMAVTSYDRSAPKRLAKNQPLYGTP